MARIAVGGWQHETNTFAPAKADFAAFEVSGGWPAMCQGQALFAGVQGVHIPISGAIDALRALGHELAPLLWCAATPSAHVTEDAFERIAGMLLGLVRDALPVDGIYLDLHGAMVCERLQDGEGELLRRLRALVGEDLPIVASLDLHANVSEAMVAHASALDLYRTYPHVDMGATGARAARHLHRLLNGEHWYKALRRCDFLIPVNWGCTLIEPARSLYEMLPGLIGDDVAALGFACGFPLADIADVGPAVVAYGSTQLAADTCADTLIDAVSRSESEFGGQLFTPAEAVTHAQQIVEKRGGPVIIADTQDNPGGGGCGDTVGMLRALVEAGARDVLFGVIVDPVIAARAHAVGVGARFEDALGERSGQAGHTPYGGDFRVLRLGDGRFTATGPMWKGARMDLGPMALLEVNEVRVAVATRAVQTADQSIFRHLGLEPARESIIVLKSSVHFRADFQALASEIIIAVAPGPVIADPGELQFRNARAGLRLRPGRDVN